jgi:hypothetical protein
VRTYRARSGPFQQQLFFSPEEIDEMCLQALGDRFTPKNLCPVRIDRFVEDYFKCPVVYAELPEGVLGCTAFNANGSIKAVVISSTIEDGAAASERRIRSTIAHEAGHCLMHPSLFMDSTSQQLFPSNTKSAENLDFQARKILCRGGDIHPGEQQKRYDGRWWEWQANRAIGGFLLPKHLVRAAVQSRLEPSPFGGIAVLPECHRREAEVLLATTFEVNPVVARIRLYEMFPQNTGQMEF